MLGASGHIAGVINPVSRHKRNFWIDGTTGPSSDTWLETATSVAGSWWSDWSRWLKQHPSREIKARKKLGNAKYRPIEPAPGRYVKVRAE